MCKSDRKLDKFVQRFNAGDFGYCSHRLKKFSRRRQDAVEAIRFVVQNNKSVLKDLDEYPRFVELMINLKDEAAGMNDVNYLDLARLALDSGLNDLWEKAVAQAPDNALLEMIKIAAERRNGAGCSPIRRYLLNERKQGLLNAIRKTYELQDEILPDQQTYAYNDSAENKESELLLTEFRHEAFDDFLGMFQAKVPTVVTIADDCQITNEFGDFGFASTEEFVQWINGLAEDRGPMIVQESLPAELLKLPNFNLYSRGWMDTRVAVVKPAGDDAKPLFVVAICGDLRDGKIRKVWISTDNRLWNLQFESPKHTEETVTITREFAVDAKSVADAGEQCQKGNIRPDDPNRPTRANELAMRINAWTTAPSEKCFKQSVWAVAVDALFGKTVFVPSTFSPDGAVKATGPVGPNGQRIYVCHVDCPKDGGLYTEVMLSGFLATVLCDEQAIGVAFKSEDGKLLVRRDTLEDLACKVGPDLTGGEEADDAKSKD